jgi:hypothetical protein
MMKRVVVFAGVVTAVLAVASLVPLPVTAQTNGPASSAPRTPWGDPDLQGNFTNLWEVGTPFERPDQFAGRRLEDIKGEELASIRRAIQERTRTEQLAGDIGGTRWIWLDSHDHAKGSAAWFVVDPPDGKIPPLTAEGRARQAARAEARKNAGRGPADSYTDRSLFDRCISRSVPGSMMPAIYGNSYQIVQAPGYVVIRYEMIHEARIIPLDGSPHLPSTVRSYMGDPRGRWEGDTLVVETTNFRDETAYRGANPATFRLIERFTRISPDKVRWAVTIDDPSTWARSWTFAMPLTLDNSEPLVEYACHEGNYAMANILSGARADERAAAQDAAKGITRPASRPSTAAEGEQER